MSHVSLFFLLYIRSLNLYHHHLTHTSPPFFLSLLQTLATKYPDVDVSAGVRDPTSAKAQKLKVSGKVTLVHADLSQPSTLAEAVRGAHTVFVNTPGDIDRAQQAYNGVLAAKDAGVSLVNVNNLSIRYFTLPVNCCV